MQDQLVWREAKDPEMRALGRAELATLAMQESKQGDAARWELARREWNKLVKKASR